MYFAHGWPSVHLVKRDPEDRLWDLDSGDSRLVKLFKSGALADRIVELVPLDSGPHAEQVLLILCDYSIRVSAFGCLSVTPLVKILNSNPSHGSFMTV